MWFFLRDKNNYDDPINDRYGWKLKQEIIQFIESEWKIMYEGLDWVIYFVSTVSSTILNKSTVLTGESANGSIALLRGIKDSYGNIHCPRIRSTIPIRNRQKVEIIMKVPIQQGYEVYANLSPLTCALKNDIVLMNLYHKNCKNNADYGGYECTVNHAISYGDLIFQNGSRLCTCAKKDFNDLEAIKNKSCLRSLKQSFF